MTHLTIRALIKEETLSNECNDSRERCSTNEKTPSWGACVDSDERGVAMFGGQGTEGLSP